MPFKHLLSPSLTVVNHSGGSKKRTLEYISGIICDAAGNIPQEDIFDGLIERERLGSTGIGEGVAIPHCRVENLANVGAVFLKLEQPIDFDAIDGKKVDLIFSLVVPSNCCDEHLSTLAELAQLFNSEDNRNALRACQSHDELYQTLIKLGQ
ncbi:MAG: PTS IIA-like nitrogen regulatory protein PtsN [Pseudomonadales bacterium]